MEYNEKEGIVVKPKVIWNSILVVLSVALNIGTLLYALITIKHIPLNNQYLIASSMFGVMTLAGMGTNMVRVLINSFTVCWPLNLL